MKRILGVIALIALFIAPGYAQDEAGGKISGTVYFDYYYNVIRDGSVKSIPNSVLKGNADDNGFLFRRIYFTYDYVFSKEFESRFRIEADESSFTDNGKFSPFVKDAYLKWNDIFPGSDLIFGLQPTLGFEVSEKVWGYRSLEKTIMDLRGALSSRDIGIALKGNITDNGLVKYGIMFGNNSSNKPETNKYKRLYGSLIFNPFKNFVINVYGDLAFNPNKTSPLDSSITVANNVYTTALFVGYSKSGILSVGAEGFLRTAKNDFMTINNSNVTFEALNGYGISLFGRVNLTEGTEFIARYDYFDPNSDMNEDLRQYIIGGVSFTPIKNVFIIPNVQFETYDTVSGKTFDSALTARLTVNYEFK